MQQHVEKEDRVNISNLPGNGFFAEISGNQFQALERLALLADRIIKIGVNQESPFGVVLFEGVECVRAVHAPYPTQVGKGLWSGMALGEHEINQPGLFGFDIERGLKIRPQFAANAF